MKKTQSRIEEIVSRRIADLGNEELEEFIGEIIDDILNPSERGYSLRTLLRCVLEEWKNKK